MRFLGIPLLILCSAAAQADSSLTDAKHFESRYPQYAAWLNQCLKNDKTAKTICYPHDSEAPRQWSKQEVQEMEAQTAASKKKKKPSFSKQYAKDSACEYDYAQKLLESGFVIHGQNLNWAGLIIFSNEVKKPGIFMHLQGDQTAIVLPRSRYKWCSGQKKVEQDILALSKLYSGFEKQKYGQSLSEEMSDPTKWVSHLEQRTVCSNDVVDKHGTAMWHKEFVPIPVKPENLRFGVSLDADKEVNTNSSDAGDNNEDDDALVKTLQPALDEESDAMRAQNKMDQEREEDNYVRNAMKPYLGKPALGKAVGYMKNYTAKVGEDGTVTINQASGVQNPISYCQYYVDYHYSDENGSQFTERALKYDFDCEDAISALNGIMSTPIKRQHPAAGCYQISSTSVDGGGYPSFGLTPQSCDNGN